MKKRVEAIAHEDGIGSPASGDDANVRAQGSGSARWSVPGTVLGGRLVIEGQLGTGGMGCVVAARHAELGTRVAVKMLLAGRSVSADARDRLLREARAAAKIGSEHVVRIHDVVSAGPGAPYVVMEYLTGETLAARLQRKGYLDIADAAELVVQASEALGEAHRGGTVHRDLKPSNLFLTTARGRGCIVKVIDFGIAKTEETDAANSTQSQTLLASPAYASPEQLRASKSVDARSDVWSLGVILYEAVAGRRPFAGPAIAEVASQVLRDAPLPLRAARPEVPTEFEKVVFCCLAKDRNERFRDVEALVRALSTFAPRAAHKCLAYLSGLSDRRAGASAARGRLQLPGDTLTEPSYAGFVARRARSGVPCRPTPRHEAPLRSLRRAPPANASRSSKRR